MRLLLVRACVGTAWLMILAGYMQSAKFIDARYPLVPQVYRTGLQRLHLNV